MFGNKIPISLDHALTLITPPPRSRRKHRRRWRGRLSRFHPLLLRPDVASAPPTPRFLSTINTAPTVPNNHCIGPTNQHHSTKHTRALSGACWLCRQSVGWHASRLDGMAASRTVTHLLDLPHGVPLRFLLFQVATVFFLPAKGARGRKLSRLETSPCQHFG